MVLSGSISLVWFSKIDSAIPVLFGPVKTSLVWSSPSRPVWPVPVDQFSPVKLVPINQSNPVHLDRSGLVHPEGSDLVPIIQSGPIGLADSIESGSHRLVSFNGFVHLVRSYSISSPN